MSRSGLRPARPDVLKFFIHKPLFGLVLLAAALWLRGQDLSTFMAQLPQEGAWASYRIETASPDRVKREPFNLAVVGRETLGGRSYLWLEVGPMDFVSYRNGYMRLLVRDVPSKEEALNPFLAAMALAYQEPGSDPFKLSDGAISFMHNQAKDIRVRQDRKDLPPAKTESVRGRLFDCTCALITTTSESSLFGRHIKSVERGTYWFSPETPFRLVHAEIERTETRNGKERKRTITVTLKEGNPEGAVSRFTKPPARQKGLLGLLFH